MQRSSKLERDQDRLFGLQHAYVDRFWRAEHVLVACVDQVRVERPGDRAAVFHPDLQLDTLAGTELRLHFGDLPNLDYPHRQPCLNLLVVEASLSSYDVFQRRHRLNQG